MNQKEYFDSIAGQWDSMCPHDPEKLTRIMELSGLRRGDRVLDVGTGTGVLIPYIRSRIGEKGSIVAADFAPNMLREAENKYGCGYGKIEFACGDVLDGSFLAGRLFDCIMCYSVFPHFPDKSDAVIKLANRLAKGGRIVVCHSSSRDTINNLHKNGCSAIKDNYLPDMDTLKSCFESSVMRIAQAVDDSDMFLLAAVL